MRCEHCQTDVAAQVAEDESIICGTCGNVLDAGGHPQLEDQLREARELLERWSKEPLLEPLEPLPGRQASHLSEVEKFQAAAESAEDEPEIAQPEPTALNENEAAIDEGEEFEDSLPDEDVPESSFEIELHEVDLPWKKPVAEHAKPKFRFDAAHLPEDAGEPEEPVGQDPVPEPRSLESDELETVTSKAGAGLTTTNAAEPPVLPPAPVATSSFEPHRIDPAQPMAVHSPPHIDIQQLIDQRLLEEKQGFNWMVFAGQWLSYLGVLGLTAGAALIVYGYFGGMSEMTPKGWMLTTAGQMLLLLGIVTLISGGLDSANTEVNTRIQVLGEQLLRFERETKEHFLRGPKIPVGQYAEGAQPDETRKTADETAES